MLDEILLLLLKRGAHREEVRITTKEIGNEIGISQQSASRRLIALAREGKIRRRGRNLSLTAEGLREIQKLHRELSSALEPGRKIIFHGKVIRGTREGRYYLKQKNYVQQIKKKLGFIPFPGTLNIEIPPDEVERRLLLKERKGIQIEGFNTRGRSFGKIECYPCKIRGVEGAVVFPERSHHGLDILEIIAPLNLRRKFSLKEGSEVRVETI